MTIEVKTPVKVIVKKDLKEFFPKEFSTRPLIGKFLDYVMNNFFQTSYEKYVNGYIGKKTVAVEEGDHYLTEVSAERQNYQLAPLLITSNDNDLENNHYTEYTNFLNTLQSQGCDITNQNRLFSEEYWSWCPPINVDMFLNYNFYYWLEDGPTPIKLVSTTNAVSDILGKSQYTYIGLNEDGEQTTIEFATGMRVLFNNDENEEFNDVPYIVENVGSAIKLLKDVDLIKSDDTSPDYFVMERGCVDGNPWSQRNRWFHRSVIGSLSIDNVTQLKQAKKPILCFNKDINLYNYGSISRGIIDLMIPIEKHKIHGLPPQIFQGVELVDGMTVVLVGEPTSEHNNMIYQVTSINSLGLVVLKELINGEDISGTPQEGEGIIIRRGTYANKYFQFKFGEWIEGQQKTIVNQPPLFELFDEDKNALSNSLFYPQTTFRGNKLFEYVTTEEDTAIIDEDLGMKILTKGYGNYLFNDALWTEQYTYRNYNELNVFEGFKFCKINGEDSYFNNWFLSETQISQYITTEFMIQDNRTIEQLPDAENVMVDFTVYDLAYQPDNIPNKKNAFVYINGVLRPLNDYIIEDKKLKFNNNNVKLNTNDIIYVKLLVSNVEGSIADGYFYDLPLTLTANSKNDNISTIAYNETFEHFKSIIENQTNFVGMASGSNNYINTSQNVSLGTEILQHSSPILKTMLLNSLELTNIRNSLNYVKNEYDKFKYRFKYIADSLASSGEFVETSNPDDIIPLIFDKLNLGKEGLSPFFNNGVASEFGECYIPATPSYLGLDILYKPEIIQFMEGSNPYLLLCHDGSYQQLFNDYRDSVLLRIEESIYNSATQQKEDINIRLDYMKFIPGKFRTTLYSQEEYNTILTPLMEKWASDNNISYTKNEDFDHTNPFTWNWSTTFTKDGEQLVGSYKAIYQYYYDTYRPHTHPWEMLGFGVKPTWWEDKYGVAPYTSSNYQMWTDIENGRIIDGANKGEYSVLKRDKLFTEYLPVNEKGELLNPYEIGLATSQPISVYAQRDWKVGDYGKAEQIWRMSSAYKYDLQTVLYLMKPLRWIERTWDISHNKYIFKDTPYEQLINSSYGRREMPSDIYVHNEYVNGEYIRNIGSQQWLSDFITNENVNITTYIGELLRNIDVKLSYRCGAFYKEGSIKAVSDNYGIIPETNYKMDLYTSITNKQYSYSGLVIQRVQEGYMIDGYDYEKPYFTVILPEKSGRKTALELNGKNVIYYNEWTTNTNNIKYKTIYSSIQDVYDIIIGYGKYLDSIGWAFIELLPTGEIKDFRTSGQDFLRWSSVNPDENMLILLNPGANGLSLIHNSFVDKIGKYNNGYWTILDTAFNPIYNDKISVYRQDGITTIEPTEKILTMVKCNLVDKEHILIFDNVTLFGDVIYDPLLCVKTQRLKLSGIAVEGWNGTYFSPGYIVNSEGAIPNYDKLVDDFKFFYDTDDVRSQGIFGEFAKKTIGYVKTSPMERLLLDERNIFDFYKGLLQEKGTKKSFGKLNRSNYIMNNQENSIELFESWGFKVGTFGFTDQNRILEFKILPDSITQDPQIVSFTTADESYQQNLIIDINWNSPNWLKKLSIKEENTFTFSDKPIVYPTGGMVKVSDVNHIFANDEEFNDNQDNINLNEVCWIIKSKNNQFDVVKKTEEGFQTRKMETIKEMFEFDKTFVKEGDLFYIVSDILLNNMYTSDGDDNLIKLFNDADNLMKLEENIIDKKASSVFRYNGENEIYDLVQCQNKIPNIENIGKSYLVYDENDNTLSELQLYDPLQNKIPNNVLTEINYITALDPVSDYGDFNLWSDEKVGYLWWDISKVRYVDYHQGDIYERRNNWGKQLPGSEIAIYEWTKTIEEPVDEENYVIKEIWNSSTSSIETYYYYWNKNPSEIPSKSFRHTSALQISKIINNPQEEGIVWLAPIYIGTGLNKYSSFIVGNFDKVISGDEFVVQLNLQTKDEMYQFEEWVSVQEHGDGEIPDTLWTKMKHSLIGKDDLNQVIPDPMLAEKNKLGINIRPRQTMFKHMDIARQNFVDVVNDIFATRNILVNVDVDKPIFNEIFYDKTPYPIADIVVETHQDMNELYDPLLKNRTILVKSDELYEGIWTLWNYNSIIDQTLLDYQVYDVSKYWSYKDLYLNELTQFVQPVVQFKTETEFLTEWKSYNLQVGNVIKYFDTNGKWVLKEYQGNNIFYTVGLEDGTIELNDDIFNFLQNTTLKNNTTLYIGDKTKYEYLISETEIVVNKIMSYFEI